MFNIQYSMFNFEFFTIHINPSNPRKSAFSYLPDTLDQLVFFEKPVIGDQIEIA